MFKAGKWYVFSSDDYLLESLECQTDLDLMLDVWYFVFKFDNNESR